MKVEPTRLKPCNLSWARAREGRASRRAALGGRASRRAAARQGLLFPLRGIPRPPGAKRALLSSARRGEAGVVLTAAEVEPPLAGMAGEAVEEDAVAEGGDRF